MVDDISAYQDASKDKICIYISVINITMCAIGVCTVHLGQEIIKPLLNRKVKHT